MMAGSQCQPLYAAVDGLPEFEDRLHIKGWTLDLVRNAAKELAKRREMGSYETYSAGAFSHKIVFAYDLLDEAAELTASSVAKLENEWAAIETIRDERAILEPVLAMNYARYKRRS